MEEELGNLELLKEHLCRTDAVSDWIVRRLSQKHWVLSWVHLQFVEDVSPDLLHIVPILNDAMFHRVRKFKDALEFFLRSKYHSQHKRSYKSDEKDLQRASRRTYPTLVQ